ncbi:hypothetical protein F0223_23535 [Vibrio coralliilyticus]|jgi:hypothetical protein|uniref:hypothetical protein n=1 Tax=Vibrio TaxID=662 RepID=UPI00050574D1|nr:MULTISPECIES: hypothetical protein [Vibrio]KFI12070.1 hypothetical protein IX95_10525 [Vibrio sp. B183]NOI21178.1 hypothetical protein [Vibrio coralliilyticus]
MKRLLMTLLTVCLSLPTWAHSPALTQLLTELNTQYQRDDLLPIDIKDKADISKLPYFLLHIDEADTPEKLKLDAYLTGLHNGIYDSVNMQRQMNAPTWFCMRDTMIMNPKRHPDFLKELIWSTLEKVANNDPEKYRRDNYAGAFMGSINGLVLYGLQTTYPCFDPIPKQLQFKSFKY